MMSNFEVDSINGSNENYQCVKTVHVHMYMQRKHMSTTKSDVQFN